MKGWNIYADDKAERGRDGKFLLFSIYSFWSFRCLLSAKCSGFQTASAGVIWEDKFWEREEFRQKITGSKILLLVFHPRRSLEYFQIPLALPIDRLLGDTVMWLILLELTGYCFPQVYKVNLTIFV